MYPLKPFYLVLLIAHVVPTFAEDLSPLPRNDCLSRESLAIGPAESDFTRKRQRLQPYVWRSQPGAVRGRSFLRGRDDRLPPNTVQPTGGIMKALPDGWLMTFIWAELGIAVEVAAALLQDFYENVLERLEPLVNPWDTMQTLSLKIHDLCLDFASDSPAISWDTVRSFVTCMLDATRRGFAGRFFAVLYHGPTQTTIRAGLRILTLQDDSDLESIGSN